MSEMIKGCWVSFESDFSEDHAEKIMTAIRLIKGVEGTTPRKVDFDDWRAEHRIRMQFQERVIEFLFPKDEK